MHQHNMDLITKSVQTVKKDNKSPKNKKEKVG